MSTVVCKVGRRRTMPIVTCPFRTSGLTVWDSVRDPFAKKKCRRGVPFKWNKLNVCAVPLKHKRLMLIARCGVAQRLIRNRTCLSINSIVYRAARVSPPWQVVHVKQRTLLSAILLCLDFLINCRSPCCKRCSSAGDVEKNGFSNK